MIEKLNTFHYEDLRNPKHPSIFAKHEEYCLFIYRIPILKDGELAVYSDRFVLFGEQAMQYDDVSGKVRELPGGVNELYRITDIQTDDVMKMVESYIDDVSDLEEELLEKRIGPDFMERWFYLKKDLNRVERLIIPATTTVDEVLREFSKRKSELTVGFQDIKEHLERTHRLALLNVKKLDEIYAFYSSQVNEKMNRTIYLLAIISAIFLPLNFIVSFFGINTGGLFFVENPNGTLHVISIIIGIAIVSSLLLILFRKKIFH